VLAERLREVAEEREIPLSHVADRAGIARSYLWRLLAAESSATLDALQRLATVLEVAPVALVTERGGGEPRARAKKGRARAQT
jgi:transcriptional regulator with XRE-family HTH domain